MINKISLSYWRDNAEGCVAALKAEVDGKEVIRTLDFGGNAIPAVLFGAVRVVNELQEILGHEPEGYVRVKRPKKIKASE